MQLSPSSVHSLRSVFHNHFSVHDITEPLMSCDAGDQTEKTGDFMRQRKLEVMGVRRDGLVAGYIQRDQLSGDSIDDCIEEFTAADIIESTTPLAEVVIGLKKRPRLFISVFGQVGGIVTKTDLQKPPFRMWLFGMITLIEMRMTHMIQSTSESDDWTDSISAGRLEKARELLVERQRRNQNLGLVDCLQFSDKTQIIAKNKHMRMRTRFDSRRQVEEAGKRLERLRNNLAHSQGIIATDWEALVELSENLDNLISGPPEPTEEETLEK